MHIELADKQPQVDEQAWVAPTAVLAGSVIVEAGASIWYGTVLRAESSPITIGARSNVQDNSVFHADPDFPATLGTGVTVGHRAIVHGATIGDFCLIGMGAVVMNGSVIGAESLIGAGSLVVEGTQIPPRSLVVGSPAKVRRQLTDDEVAGLHRSAETYERHTATHRAARHLS